MAKIDPLALGRDERQRLVADLQAWFQDERGERIGELAAELLIDFFQVSAGKAWYNRGVQDAQAVLRDRMERLVDDVDLLRR
jgi:uncharacterized protein (DUF2164 family)